MEWQRAGSVKQPWAVRVSAESQAFNRFCPVAPVNSWCYLNYCGEPSSRTEGKANAQSKRATGPAFLGILECPICASRKDAVNQFVSPPFSFRRFTHTTLEGEHSNACSRLPLNSIHLPALSLLQRSCLKILYESVASACHWDSVPRMEDSLAAGASARSAAIHYRLSPPQTSLRLHCIDAPSRLGFLLAVALPS